MTLLHRSWLQFKNLFINNDTLLKSWPQKRKKLKKWYSQSRTGRTTSYGLDTFIITAHPFVPGVCSYDKRIKAVGSGTTSTALDVPLFLAFSFFEDRKTEKSPDVYSLEIITLIYDPCCNNTIIII